MLRLFKSCIATGVAMFLAVTAHSHECRAASNLIMDDPISCSNTAGLDADTAAFVNLQCGIQAQCFPGSTDTTSIYQTASLIDRPGSYDITGVAGQAGKVVVDWAEAGEPVTSNDPDTGAVLTEATTSIVIGHLVTDASSVAVMCVSYSFKDPIAHTVNTGIAVAKRLTEQQVADRLTELRLAAGPRFVDALTGTSYGLYDYMPGRIFNASTTTSDLSTITCTFVPLPDGAVDESLDCVAKQWRKYQDDLQTCRESLRTAIKWAMIGLSAALALCLLRAALPPPLNIAAVAACIVTYVVALAVALGLALEVFDNCTRAAARALKTNLINNCGIVVYEM